jgi:transposase InsO family protein
MQCREDRLNPPTRESVELATSEWVTWYNHHRLLAPVGYIPPAEAEANYYALLNRRAEMSDLL